MIDPQRPDAAIQVIMLVNRGQPVHPVVELDRNPVVVRRCEGPALKRPFGPVDAVAKVPKIPLGPIEVFLVIGLERDQVRTWPRRRFQDQAMMAPFFHPPKIDTVVRLSRHLQPNDVAVELAACPDVGDRKFDMAQPNRIERRVENRVRNGHELSLRASESGGRTWRRPRSGSPCRSRTTSRLRHARSPRPSFPRMASAGAGRFRS